MSVRWDNTSTEFIDSLYDDFAKEIRQSRNNLDGLMIAQFIPNRLHSYYLNTPYIVDRARWALAQARALLSTHPEASLVFAVTAAEVGIKSGMLKPILHGLLYDGLMPAVVAELASGQRNDRSKNLLFGILREYGGVDLKSFKRDGTSKSLWQEMEDIRNIRNEIIYSANSITPEDAVRAAAVAEHILMNVYPSVLRKLGLKKLAYEASRPLQSP